jgi:hypothetical protein
MYSILIYSGTNNLGDAIQAYAMARLLPRPLQGIYRHKAHQFDGSGAPLVINGWLGDKAPNTSNCLFAGVHIGRNNAVQIEWIKKTHFKYIGVRDAYTGDLLKQHGVTTAIETIGCATMTLPRYLGPRQGILNVDLTEKRLNSASDVTNRIPSSLNWIQQWTLAEQRLSQLRNAELVYTNRLHVALPCIAMGTPVFMPKTVLKYVKQPERLSCLDMFGFRYNEPFVTDISGFAKKYIDFLAHNLGILITPSASPPFPSPSETHEPITK